MEEEEEEEEEDARGQSLRKKEAGLRPDRPHCGLLPEAFDSDDHHSDCEDQDDGSATGQRCFRDSDGSKDHPINAGSSGNGVSVNQTLTERLDKEIESEKQVSFSPYTLCSAPSCLQTPHSLDVCHLACSFLKMVTVEQKTHLM